MLALRAESDQPGQQGLLRLPPRWPGGHGVAVTQPCALPPSFGKTGRGRSHAVCRPGFSSSLAHGHGQMAGYGCSVRRHAIRELSSMPVHEDISAIHCGARFYRADLHVHSYGGSHDVSDTGMVPERIVETAVAQRLAIIAVTDHNEITNVAATVAAAAGRPLLVVPGVELTTAHGHLLVVSGICHPSSPSTGGLRSWTGARAHLVARRRCLNA